MWAYSERALAAFDVSRLFISFGFPRLRAQTDKKGGSILWTLYSVELRIYTSNVIHCNKHSCVYYNRYMFIKINSPWVIIYLNYGEYIINISDEVNEYSAMNILSLKFHAFKRNTRLLL